MKIIITILIIGLLLTGCSFELFSAEEPPEAKGNTIKFDGVTFTYKTMGIRDWKQRTDIFTIDEEGCLLMKGVSHIDTTFHESHFMVRTDLDLCEYKYVKLNSSIESITQRLSNSPSSQIWIQNHKYSSGSLDNITKYLYSNNLKFYNDQILVSWIDDEGDSYGDGCNNLTIEILATADVGGTSQASLQICGISLGEKW